MTQAELLDLLARAKAEGWKELDLAGMDLEELPPEIGELTELEILVLGKFDYEAWETKGNKLTTLPPEIGQLSQLTSLSLSSNQLSSVPAEIGQLSQLTSLSLSSNQLSSVPAEIAQLSQLTTLSLRRNQLSSVPAEIGQLSQLTTLYLSGNQLSSVPAEIAQLSQLTRLDLSYNQLSSVPAEIGQLSQLTRLDLSYNQLSSVPAEIGQLSQLTELDLRDNQLSSVPAEIGQLSQLTSLFLSSNQLSSVPAEIGQLSQLTSLSLSSNQLSSVPAEIGQLSQLTTLDLGGNQLSSVPAEIAQLSQLTSLSLRYNQLSSVPAEIAQLSQLTTLDLRYNQLSSVPAEIAQLSQLTSLSLSSNQLSSVPAEIAQLSQLTTLDLRYNQLSSVPAEIAQLSQLTSLYLSDNQLSSVPAEIGQLSQLTSLYLSDNQLSSVPAEIGQLSQLTSLYLSDNQLSSVPAEIAQLSQLTRLDLMNLQLAEFPKVVTQLEQLEYLDLDGNAIATVPPELAQLTQLKTLDLRSNRFTEIPDEICTLTQLEKLYLQNNTIRELPEALQRLENLKDLNISGNPIRIPLEIAKDTESPAKILDFYFSTEYESEPLYEAKLILVGDGGAGKTTLANKLQNPDYELSTDPDDWTRGIDVLPWEIQHPSGNPYRINIWDFGGQQIYHTTHQFFLSRRSVYVLLHDNRKGNTDFQYWLDNIRLLGGKNSPIIIVKNERGECRLDESAYHIDDPENLIFKTVNLATNIGLNDLRQTIENALCNLEGIGDPLLIPWANIRNVLQNLSRNRNYIDQYDYFDYCKQNGFQTHEEMRRASRFFHELGICLHFQNERNTGLNTTTLDHTLILKPTWATDAIYKIYDDPEVRENCGRFDDAKLREIWNTGDDAAKCHELLDLMKKFKLCYELRNHPNNYIAPTFLKRDSPAYTWDTTDNLELRYFYTFKPRGLFLEFIVELHRQIADNLVWRHGVVLQNESGDVRAEVIEDPEYRETTIKIRVSGTGDKRRFLQVVAYELQKIQNAYDDKLSTRKFEYQTQVPCICSECSTKADRHFYDWSMLERRYQKGKTTVDCGQSVETVNLVTLIDNISTWRSDRVKPIDRDGKDRPDLYDGRSPITAPPLVQNFYIQPEQTMTNITQTHHGSGDNVAGDKNTTITNNASPAETAELLKTLLKDLDLNGNSDRDDLKDELLYQPPAQQNQLWDWMDAVIRNPDTRDEAIKTFAEVLGSLFGLPGTITAGAFKVGYTALTKARSKRNELPADYENPFDASGL